MEDQCATFPIDQGPDLGKNWVGQGKLSNLVARQSMVISCVLLYDSIFGLNVYTVSLWWIILTLDWWSMTSANTISHTVRPKCCLENPQFSFIMMDWRAEANSCMCWELSAIFGIYFPNSEAMKATYIKIRHKIIILYNLFIISSQMMIKNTIFTF